MYASSPLEKEIMEEQELNSREEVATQYPESQDQSQTNQEPEPQPQVEDRQDRNWREMRERQMELEKRLQQKDEMLEKFMQAQLNTQAPQPLPEPEEPDEEYIPKGRVKGIAQKAVQPLEAKIQALEAKLAQQEQHKYMNSLRSKYSDFDDVVNVETLELLEKKEPELAATIAETKDPYKMAIQSYKYIKALNLVEDLPSAKRSKEIQKKLDANSKTVQSPMAYDKRPMAQAFKTTAADQTRLYEEMMHYAGQATGL